MTLRRSERQLSIAILTFEQTFGLQGSRATFGIHENILKSGWAGNLAQCCSTVLQCSTVHSAAQYTAQCTVQHSAAQGWQLGAVLALETDFYANGA